MAALEPQPVPVVAEPEPLDLGSLEAAVAEATAAFDAVQAVVDPADPAQKELMALQRASKFIPTQASNYDGIESAAKSAGLLK